MNKFVSFMLIFFFTSGTFTVACNSVLASELIEDSWYTKTPMSQARYSLGVAAVDGKIYAIGGGTESGRVGTNECYNPVMDTWVTLEPMPTIRSGFVTAAVDGKIYCIGGGYGTNSPIWYELPTFTALDVNEVYDPATDSWSTKQPIPMDGKNLYAHVVDGKIFVIKQYNDDDGKDSIKGPYKMYMYDPVKDSWTKKTSLPQPRDTASYTNMFKCFSVAIDNKIIVNLVYHNFIHGNLSFKETLMIYDVKTDKWQEGNRPPWTTNIDGIYGNSEGMSAVTSGRYAPQRAYIFFEKSDYTWIYNLADDTWSTTKAVPTQREGFGVAVVDDVFYTLGGYIYEDYMLTPVTITEKYVPIGYRSTAYTTPEPSDSQTTSKLEPFKPPLIYFIVITLAIIIGAVITGLVFYFRKRKRWNTGNVSNSTL